MPQSITPKKIQSVELRGKKYSRFAGVDFSTDPTQVSDQRSPEAQNLISDLAGFPEKRDGWRVEYSLGEAINGMFYTFLEAGHMLAHANATLYELKADGTTTTLYASMNNAKSVGFSHGGKFYILDGANYLVLSESAGVITVSKVSDHAFVPTTVIGAPATGGGTPFEAINLLTPKRSNSMTGDTFSVVFTLDTQDLDSVNTVKVEGTSYTLDETWSHDKPTFSFLVPAEIPTGTEYYVNVGSMKYIVVDSSNAAIVPTTLTTGDRIALELTQDKGVFDYYMAKPFTHGTEPTVTAVLDGTTYNVTNTTYNVNLEAGTVTFALPPQAYSGGAGVDNVIITFSKAIAGYTDRIEKCTIFASYGYNNDNRMFFSGNPDYKNMDWQSGLDDPTYFPDTGYTSIGTDDSAIMGYLKQYDCLTIIKEDNDIDAEIFLRTAAMDDNNKVYFPVKQGVKGVGAVSKHAFGTLRDDPLYLSKRGVFAVASTTVNNERSIQDRSYYVNTKLTKEKDLNSAVAAVWKGWYVLCVNNHCYVADGRKKSGNGETYGYEWFYWTNIPATVFLEQNEMLWFGTSDGDVCVFSSDDITMGRYADNGEAVHSYWTTKADDLGIFTRKKSMTKKGAGVMIKPYNRSSVNVYVITDKDYANLIKTSTMDIFTFSDIDFSRITFNTKESPQVVPFNKKVKKFITIQFVFENKTVNEGFGVYGCEFQYILGNYVK